MNLVCWVYLILYCTFHKKPTAYNLVTLWDDEGLCVTLQHSEDIMPLVCISNTKVSLIQDHGVGSAQC